MAAKAHYLLVALPKWGHCRPEATFGLRLIKMHPHLCITMMLPEWIKERTEQAVAEVSLTAEEQERVQIVYWPFTSPPPCDPDAGESDTENARIFSEWCAGCVADSMHKVLKGEAEYTVPGAKPFAIPPSVLMCDVLVWWGLKAMTASIFDEHGLARPKAARLLPVSEAYVLIYSKSDKSPYVEVMQEYQDARSQGLNETEAFERTFVQSTATFDEATGILPMYIREADPNWSARIHTHMTSIYSLMKNVNDDSLDIVFWPSYAAIHDQPQPRKWGLPTVRAGPQLAEVSSASVVTNGVDGVALQDPAVTFLDQALADKGVQSVIYICFGSTFWPPTESQTSLLFDALEKSGMHVLLVQHEFSLQSVGDRVKQWGEKMKGRVLIHGWTPQLEVLRHPAVSVFLSHGGSNSAMEAMLTGVPMVIWPGAWDQPFIASELVRAGNAIEIVQGRTGHNVGRKTARGVYISGKDEDIRAELEEVFCNIHSEEFEAIRQKATEIQARVREDMSSGESNEVMQRLGHLAEA